MTDVQMREGLVTGQLVTVDAARLNQLINAVADWKQRAEAAENALAEAQREINALWGDGGRKLLAEAAEDTTLLDKAQRIGIAINGYGHGGLYDKSSVRAAIRAVREKV